MKEYIYIHNTNMMKYCAINLNERYRLSFKYSRDNTYVFSKNIIDFLQHMYLHWHYFIKNSSRWSVKMWKNWKMVFIEIDWSQRIRERKSLFKVPICSTSISEVIIYKSFGITYYFIHQFTSMEKMARKRNGRCSNI